MKKNFCLLLSTTLMLSGTLLTTSCSNKEQILIYTTSEEERNAFYQEELNKQFPDYEIIIQYSGTGALVSKMQGEGINTECDIILELEANNMELLLTQNDNFFADLSDYDFSQFTDTAISYGHKKYAPTCITYGAVFYNEKVLREKDLSAPTTYADLLDPKYKGLISMPNPKSSGTGYLFYNGLVSLLGEDAGLDYYNRLNSNISEFTSSGSAPIKAVNRGEIGIGLGMLWQAVLYSKTNSDIKYTFLDQGVPLNLYCMAMINGHEKRKCVKEVFDYVFNTLNKKDCEKFLPDPIYKDYTPEDSEYPVNVPTIDMKGLFDPDYKANLLDKWTL